MTGRERRILAASVACLAASMLTMLVAMGGMFGSPYAAWGASSTSRGQQQTDRGQLAALTNFEEVAERPLFNPTRRPVTPPPPAPIKAAAQQAPPPPLPPEPPATRILAVAIGPGRRAAVLQLTNGKTAVVLEGGQVGSWILTRVLPDRAILTSPEAATTLSFTLHKKSQRGSPTWLSQAGPTGRF